jgi:hypothetical protein
MSAKKEQGRIGGEKEQDGESHICITPKQSSSDINTNNTNYTLLQLLCLWWTTDFNAWYAISVAHTATRCDDGHASWAATVPYLRVVDCAMS